MIFRYRELIFRYREMCLISRYPKIDTRQKQVTPPPCNTALPHRPLSTTIPSYTGPICLWRPPLRLQGPDSIKRYHLTKIGNPIVDIRRSYDRLISTMGFPILVRWCLYIESGPSKAISARCATNNNHTADEFAQKIWEICGAELMSLMILTRTEHWDNKMYHYITI